ncbi:MAG: hypothetical protein KGP28_05965 [Bdellovibrionales bacterium]|nr:hypothetical protein [Bdellovibrionales bacterium]
MRNVRVNLGFLILLTSLTSQASALNLLGGLNYAAPTDIRSGIDQRPTGSASSVFGISLDLPFSELPFSFESGVFLKSSRSETSAGGTNLSEGDWTDIPLLVHYHFDPSVSLGFGGYWSFFRGGNAIQQSESPDSGVLLDLRARIRVTESIRFLVDGRYLHGLSNLAALAGDTYNTRSVQVLCGFSYDFFTESKTRSNP